MKNYVDLVKYNLEPLVVWMQGLLQQLSKLKLSWFDHVKAVKMVVLPRFLFLFQSAIMDILHKQLMSIQNNVE